MSNIIINAGSTDDVKASLYHCEAKMSIKDLWENLFQEKQSRRRVTVVNMLQAAINRKWKKLSGKELFANYPKKKAALQYYYVRWPNQQENGKWSAVNVNIPTGYIVIPGAVEFDTEQECSNACDVENKLCGFSKKQVLEIISESINNSIYQTPA